MVARGNQTREATTSGDRRAQKRQRREAQYTARARWENSERRKRQLVWGGGILLAVAALAALLYWLFGPESGPPVQSVAIQGRTHIERTQPHPPYNSTPPTSGWHYGDAVAPWGISKDPVPNEVQVHNLEHGGVMVQYDCPSGCPEMVSQLENIGRSYRSKVVVAPYPGIPGHPIALTAWGRIAYLDQVDEAFIRRFISRYKDKAPEFIPDN